MTATMVHKDVLGITHYRVTVYDDNGNSQYGHEIAVRDNPVYTHEFLLNDGTYTFAVDAGYVDDGKFYPLSDKAQVEFDIPDDYNDYNQEPKEIVNLLNSIVGAVREEEDDFDAFYDSDWDYTGYSADGKAKLTAIASYAAVEDQDETAGDGIAVSPEEQTARNVVDAANESRRELALIIYLNNLYN